MCHYTVLQVVLTTVGSCVAGGEGGLVVRTTGGGECIERVERVLTQSCCGNSTGGSVESGSGVEGSVRRLRVSSQLGGE